MNIDRIILDAGHGPGNGHGGVYDPGAIGCFHSEHEMVSEVAKRVAGMSIPLVEVVRVPELPLRDVVAWVNREAGPGDVLFSLHMNAAETPEASGVEVLIALASPAERRAEALLLARELSQTLRLKNRGLKFDVESVKGAGRGLPIVRDTSCPAFLLELGFISNKNDVAAVEARGAEAIRNAVLALKEEG